MRVSLFVFALLALIAGTDAQRYFSEVIPSGVSWSPREKANVEFITKQTNFYDGNNGGRLVTLNNYFLLYGGVTDVTPANDVWASTNGRAWVWVAGSADGEEHPRFPETFPQVYEPSHCQDSQFRQYRVGGQRDGQVYNDVWMSIDGMTWREQTSAADFEPVYLANMVGDTNGAIYLAGGILDASGDPRQSSSAVWRSVDQGRRWTPMTRGVDANGVVNGPGARAVSILLNAEQNLIWMTGVNSGYENGDRPESYQKDVWVSTTLGRTWQPVNLNTPFGRRDDSNAEMSSAGIIVLAGGYGGTGDSITGNRAEVYNDVWASADGGYSWGLCVSDAEWDDRRYQMTLLDNEGYLWVMGGVGNGGGGNRYGDIWKSTWSFADASSTASRCRLNIASCGAGLKCLPNSGSTLVSADGTGVYCDACPYTFSGQSATTITAFLVVFIILFAVAVLALIYTYYKLRSAGAPSPIPLPATAQRWWNKSTTGAVGGAADTSSTTNGDGLYQPLRIRDQV